MAQVITIDDTDVLSASLQPYFQSGNLNFLLGSGASMPAIQVAGNIESQINDLLVAGDETQADLMSLNFIESIENISSSIKFYDILGGSIESVFNSYHTFVTCVDKILFERKNSILPRQANIFTTNYDTFIEEATATLPAIILNDGFDRTSAFDGRFKFAPELFFDRTYRSGNVYNRQSEVPTINLFKLHGSTTWQKVDQEIHFRGTRVKALSTEEKADPAAVSNSIGQRALILPNVRKFNSTLMDRVYYDLLRIFANSLDRENALLVSFGFSFVDEHIQDITKRALRNPTAQLLIFAFNTLATESFRSIFEHHRNVIIYAPADGQVTDFTALNKILADIPPVQITK